MYSTYIFDLDGTLLDTLTDLAASCNYALRTHGMPEHSIDDVRRFVGNGVRKLMERAIPDGDANPDFEATFATFPLAELKARGCRLAVVSNKMMAATVELCKYFFPETIEVAIGENEAEGIRKKPAPDTVFAALKQLGVSGDNAVYVGDSDVDLATARNSGLPCISVLWGFRDREFLLDHGATTFITSPKELLD